MKEEPLLPDVNECISKFKLTFKNVIDPEIEDSGYAYRL